MVFQKVTKEREHEELKGITQEVEMSKETEFLVFILGPWVMGELLFLENLAF